MPKAVVKKKRKVQNLSSVQNTSKDFGLPTSPQEQPPLPPKAGVNWGLRLRIVVVVLAVLIYGYMHSGHKFSIPALSLGGEPAPIQWGPALKLEKISSFDAPADTLDFYVAPNGDAIFVDSTGMYYYSGGKLTISAKLPSAYYRSIACDGSHIYVASADETIARFNMNLSPAGSFAIKGEGQILGIAWSPGLKTLFASGLHSDLLHELSPAGKLLKTWNFGYPAAGRFYQDILVSPSLIISCDVSTRNIELMKVDASGAVEKDREVDGVYSAYTDHIPNLRMALLNDHLYVPTQLISGAVMVMDTLGNPKGYLRAPDVIYTRAGADGFLYLFADGTIKKYKAL